MKILRPYSHNKMVDLGILYHSIGVLRSMISLGKGKWRIVLKYLYSRHNSDWFSRNANIYILPNE